jgi:hypothetical protein
MARRAGQTNGIAMKRMEKSDGRRAARIGTNARGSRLLAKEEIRQKERAHDRNNATHPILQLFQKRSALPIPKRRVFAICLQKFLMRPLLHNLAFV